MAEPCNVTAFNQTNCTNLSNPMSFPTCDDSPSTSSLLIAIFLFFILFLTFFGNFLVIAVVIAYERLRKVTNYFIVSLAVADLLTVFLSHPFKIYMNLHNNVWCSTLNVCSLMLIMDGVLNSASMCGLAAISIDRLIAISMPFRYGEIVTQKTSFFMIAAVWVYSLFWGLMTLVNFSNPGEQHINFRPSCFKVDRIYYTCVAAFAFFLPLIVVLISYSVIFKAAVSQAKAVAALDPNRNQRKRTMFFREVKATKVIALVIAAFVICWLPLFIIYMVSLWDRENTLQFQVEHPDAHKAITYIFLTILPPSNSCINPFIYALFNSNFRSAFAKFLRLPQRPSREMDHTMVTTATAYPERPSYTTVTTENDIRY